MTVTAPARALARVGDIDASLGGDTLATLASMFERHGDAFRLEAPLLGKDVLVLSHPDHVRHVLVEHHANFTKGIGIERVAILLGSGLMTSEGATWRAQRKAIQPAFHRTALSVHAADIVAVNGRLAERMLGRAHAFDLSRDLSEATLEIVLRAVLGAQYERMTADTNPFALLTDEADRNLRFAYALRNLGGLLQQEIERRRATHEPATDILQAMIDARDKHTGAAMADRQIRDEVFTLIVAGHETTASALSWTWHLLLRHPAVEARVTAEARAASPAQRSNPQPGDFPCTQRVIAEALRLYPPGWILTRRALAAGSIAGVDVAAGENILISPYLVHRHPAFWANPEAFEPDRFLPSAVEGRSRFAYLPFGLGPRACIGEPLADTEMLTHVVTLSAACQLSLLPGQTVELDARVNLRPRHGISVRSTRRSP